MAIPDFENVGAVGAVAKVDLELNEIHVAGIGFLTPNLAAAHVKDFQLQVGIQKALHVEVESA